jgi:NTE family protein
MSDPEPTEDPGWIREADAVFRGGGIKVVGLIGALIGFETHPRRPIERWVSTGGTSSGAIVASYLIVDRGPHAAQRLIEKLDPERLAGFVDFPLGRKYVGGLPRLLARRGMASGAALERWLDELLGGATFAIAGPADGSDDWRRSRLKLIAFDVTNRHLLVLPEDLPRYRLPGSRQPIDPATFPIARAARMSTSMPYLFEPVTLEQIAVPDPNRPGRLLAVTPRPATIVDGGAVSTFPVWLFVASLRRCALLAEPFRGLATPSSRVPRGVRRARARLRPR